MTLLTTADSLLVDDEEDTDKKFQEPSPHDKDWRARVRRAPVNEPKLATLNPGYVPEENCADVGGVLRAHTRLKACE